MKIFKSHPLFSIMIANLVLVLSVYLYAHMFNSVALFDLIHLFELYIATLLAFLKLALYIISEHNFYHLAFETCAPEYSTYDYIYNALNSYMNSTSAGGGSLTLLDQFELSSNICDNYKEINKSLSSLNRLKIESKIQYIVDRDGALSISVPNSMKDTEIALVTDKIQGLDNSYNQALDRVKLLKDKDLEFNNGNI